MHCHADDDDDNGNDGHLGDRAHRSRALVDALQAHGHTVTCTYDAHAQQTTIRMPRYDGLCITVGVADIHVDFGSWVPVDVRTLVMDHVPRPRRVVRP